MAARTPAPKIPPPWRRAIVLKAVAVLGISLLLVFVLNGRKPHSNRGAVQVPLPSDAREQAHYATSVSCRECHKEEYQLWAASHHGLAERVPEAKLDEQAFNPGRTALAGAQAIGIGKHGIGYQVVTAGAARTQEVFVIGGVLGVAPLRQFLVAFPGGRFQALEAAYDPRSNDWFSVFGAEERRVGDWGHWTGRGMNWNSMCADCHNTSLRKNYDAARDEYHTTMAEKGVGCEACHGALKQHEEWQHRFGRSGRMDPTLPKWTRAQQIDTCGSCHARRGDLTGQFTPGANFLDHMRLEVVDASATFYPDGQIHEEDYEYASFLSSRMHWRGVHCGDCHNPHSAKTILPGNWLCLRCHNGSYTNAPIIDPVAHSHHQVFGYDGRGTPTNLDLTSYATGTLRETGGECVNCHMPQTAYMQRHWRHDHGFTIPDPLLTKEIGVPNACNRCHKDKNTDWALGYVEAWYGDKMKRPSRQRARVIAQARKVDPAARPALMDMLATNEMPYWRAVSAGLLEPWANDPTARTRLCAALNDSNALVRIECIRALESVAPEADVGDSLTRKLDDPVRGVRVAAAWALRSGLELSSRAADELQHCLAFNADQPIGQLQLGAFALARGDTTQAAAHYQKAVDRDPNAPGIRRDYAVVLAELHQPQQAVEQLRAACRLEPTNVEFQYSLALAWNEVGQTAKTIECLRIAVRMAPNFSPAWYNLGLALDLTGQSEEALQALATAENANHADARAPYATATILGRLGRTAEALQAAQRAFDADPKFEPARELLENLKKVRPGR